MSDDRLALARRWVREYTPNPHPDLGRDGVVCPYMVRALRRNYVRMESFDAARDDEELVALARRLLDDSLRRAKTMGPDRTYLVSLIVPHGKPEDELKALVGRAHAVLKPDFVQSGYMAGDFWPDHETVGLHSDTFRPFTSPVPILGMRPIVPADLLFFVKHEPTPQDRLRYLRYFQTLFSGRLNEYWQAELDRELDRAERDAQATRSTR
ncbi:DUF6875 domain-containing protein [Saccharopolyspora phatthalungensis]|uniref:DUF6875 domain-containing protein n=1 Tax=Saccharopolyspora phatthalungensis TaxID=664693 RepID=A0A840Q4G5_9PSEU|nr:hypothetical protein [Saccharopolyspora phatthalungensis]MBB5153628.1 hypothetical protein [Saccharopolyspora phatthalungensis]